MNKLCVTAEENHPFINVESPVPAASGFDILVQVKAGSINPVDTKVRASFTGTGHKCLGYDGAGVVVACGELVQGISAGDSVYYAGDISRDGSNAEFQLVDSRIAAHMPVSCTFEDAASVPLTTLTAYESLFDRMNIPFIFTGPVLIINGAGGVGSMAIQLLKAKAACTVIATASRDQSKSWCKKMGADHVIDHAMPLLEQLHMIGFNTVPYILCAADSTTYWRQMAEVVSPQGTIAALVDFREPVDLNLLKRKSATFVWELMFSRPLFSTADLLRQREILTEVASLIDRDAIYPAATESLGELSVETLAEGHRRIAEGKTIGKITWHR